MNILKKTPFVISFFLSVGISAQVGIGTSSPSTSAILELNSTNQGLLFNKIALQGTNSAAPLSAHQQGMWVYNTATAGTYPNNVVPGLYYNDGTKWMIITASESFPKIGDIKPSMFNSDHEGWYILDGRVITTLSSSAISNASSIGISGNLPNATDRILKGKSTTEQFPATGGTNAIILAQANLPSQEFKGTTSSTADHTHTMNLMGNTFWNLNNSTTPKVTGLSLLPVPNSRTTTSAGDHFHDIIVPSGGTNAPISNYPKNMSVIYFIYLGK